VRVVSIQLVESKKLCACIRQDDTMGLADMQLDVPACNAGPATGCNQPKMLVEMEEHLIRSCDLEVKGKCSHG